MTNTKPLETLPGLPSAPKNPERQAQTLPRKNIYLCKTCGHGFVTADIAHGTTPFGVRCDHPGCEGMAFSLFYGAPQPVLADITPAFEWYAPTAAELATCTAGQREHVAKGGLLKRRYVAPAA